MAKQSQIFFILGLLFLLKSVQSLCSTACLGCLCQTCADVNNCGSCINGYGVATIGLSRSCVNCPTNCLLCSTNSILCTACSLGYGVITGGQCDFCANSYCRNCQNSNTYCLECRVIDGIGLQAGDCTNCRISNCKNCQTNALACVGCYQRYGFTANSTCEPCQVENCLDCYTDFTICTVCIQGYFLVNSTCLICTPNCAQCLNETDCQQCKDTYGVVIADGTCLTCTDLNCLKCPLDRTVCNQCIISYGLSNGTCIPCADNKCKDCNANALICVECIEGYGEPTTGCVPCTSPCLTCSSSITTCTSCIQNYVPVAWIGGYLCTPCSSLIPNCFACQNDTVCQQCINGYYTFAPAICNLCPINCTQCFKNTIYNLPECTACSAGSSLSNDLPPLCQQECGDGITTSHMCDNPLNIPFDGCDNFCDVENGFECIMDAGNTICSYNQTLHIEFMSAVRVPDSNKFEIKFIIFPPLYIFSQLSSAQLQQLFSLNTSALQINSIKFDPLTSTMIFEAQLIQNIMASQTISITFTPFNSTAPQFFASKRSACSFVIPYSLYYYSEFGLLFVRLGSYVCYGIVALGWIAWIIGIFQRKLAGLEAMIVLQYCWLPILLTKCQFSLQFQEVFPLKFTTIYSPTIISENKLESIDSPFFSQFQVSQEYLSNNFNIQLIIMFLFLIFIIITLIRLRKCVQQAKYKFNRKGENTKQSLQMQAEKIMNQNQLAYSTFMNVCMTFFTYFVFCSVIFFKYGRLTDICSIVVLLLGLTLYIFIYVQMCRDPSCFDYFRYSFRCTNLAMSHYFILPLCLLISTVLLTALSDFNYVAGVPLLLIIIYTLVYRPYKQMKQNIRSTFNFLVMLSFVIYMLYAEVINREELSSNTSIGIFMVNILMLLIVVIWSIIIMILSFYYKNCTLQSQEIKETNKQQEQERKLRYKILQQLGIVDLRKNMSSIEKQTTLRQVFQKDMNNTILNISNQLQNSWQKQVINFEYNEKTQIKIQSFQDSSNKLYKKHRSLFKNSELISKVDSTERENGIVKDYESKFVMNTLESKQNMLQIKEGSPLRVNKQEIVRNILIQESKYIKLRSAIDQIYQDMQKQTPNDQIYLDQFDKINIYQPKVENGSKSL